MLRSVLLAVVVTAGCGSASYRIDGTIDRSALSAADAARHRAALVAAEAAWARRADPAQAEAAIARFDEAVRIKDDDWRSYARLSEALFFLADAHLGFQAMGGDYPYDGGGVADAAAAARYRRTLKRGYQVALRGMAARSPEFEQRLRGGIDLEVAIKVIRKDAAPLVFWYVSNLAVSARAEGFTALFSSRSRIIACVEQMRAIDPAYYHAGADRLLGIYYAAAPPVVGGNLDRSRQHFDAAIAADPAFHMTSVFVAEFLARKLKDRALFEERLQAVVASPPDQDGELAAENAAARKKAQRLLGRIDRYFPAQ